MNTARRNQAHVLKNSTRHSRYLISAGRNPPNRSEIGLIIMKGSCETCKWVARVGPQTLFCVTGCFGAREGVRSLFLHNIDRSRQVHDCLFTCANRQILTAAPIASEDCGFSPIQIPTIFDSNDRVRAWTYVKEGETAIEIGLFATEEIVIAFR